MVNHKSSTEESDSEDMRREKAKGREKKWESLPRERERRHHKIMFPTSIDEDNIYRKYNAWERDCFPKKKFGKQHIKNKPYFY